MEALLRDGASACNSRKSWASLACRLHIRRTDKVGSEAAYHNVQEYMQHAVAWFDALDARTAHKHKRRVFIASDEPTVIPEARNQ